MSTTYDEPLGFEILRSEIRSKRNSVKSLVRTRKAHPSYGVTKAALREELAHLEGMLFAFWIVSKEQRSASILLAAREAAAELEIELNEVRTMVEEA